MSKTFILSTCIWMCTMVFSFTVYSQNIKNTLSGTIKTSDGSPATYITVGIKGTSKATQTDENGNFTLKGLTEGSHYVKISGVGIKAKELQVAIKAGKNLLGNITISESSSQLEGVEISGYKSSNQKPATLGKSGIAPKDLPQAVQVITAQVIQDQQADRLGDVMKNVNGVALGANRGSVGENFYARGYSLGSNNIFKNGARTSIGGSPEASTLEAVEVLKGSAALLYGGVTGGAVVNMVTKKPRFDRTGGEVSFRTGSYDEYKGIADVYGPIDDKFAFRIIGTGEKTGSFRDHVESKRFYINPSILYKANEKTDVLFQADYLKSDYTPDFGVGSVDNVIVDYGRDKFLNTPWAYNNTNTATIQLNVNHKFNDNWKLNAIAGYQNYDRDYYGSERINPPATGIVARNLNRARTEEYTYNQQVNLTGNFRFLGMKNTLLIGLDADQSRVTSNTFNYINEAGTRVASFNYGTVNVFDPSTYEGNGYMPQAVAMTETLTPVYRYGAFIQNLFEITSKFKVLAGIRYTDQKTARVVPVALVSGATVAAATATKFDDAFSPKLGLIYQPLKTTSVYASYANNFTINTGIDIATDGPMGPSIIDQYEAGIKNDFFGGRLTANATYYKIKNNNLAQAAIADPTKKEFTGATESDGFEVDITGALAKGLNIIAGYAYNFMRYTKTLDNTGSVEGVRLVGTTKNTANATLFYTVQNGAVKGLKLGASAFYTGDRNGGWNLSKDPTVTRTPIPLKGFTTIDLSAGYTWSRFSLLGKLSNITNELNYYVHENYSVNPIPPRQFLTTLSYRF